MEYRKLPRGEEKISVLGVGTSSIGMAEEKEIEAAISLALENGINYFKGHKRVIVRLEGVVSVATSYIPGSFLEKIK